jgi:hypothetical protein
LCLRLLRPLRAARFSLAGTKSLREIVGCSLLESIIAGGVRNAATSSLIACLHFLWSSPRRRFPHILQEETLRHDSNVAPSGSAPPHDAHFYHATCSTGVGTSIPTHILCQDRLQSSHALQSNQKIKSIVLYLASFPECHVASIWYETSTATSFEVLVLCPSSTGSTSPTKPSHASQNVRHFVPLQLSTANRPSLEKQTVKVWKLWLIVVRGKANIHSKTK